MNAIVKEYLDWKGTYALRASINYKVWLGHFVKICGEKPLDKYDVSDIVKFRYWLDLHYSPCSISLAMVVIKNFLKYCQMQNYPCLSPALVRLPRVTLKSHRAVTEKEFELIVSVIRPKDFHRLRDLVIIRLLWDTGTRISELLSLDVSQIDENKYMAIIRTKKTGRKRMIVWSAKTHKLLMQYMSMRLKLREHNRSAALFIGLKKGREWSSRLTAKTVQRQIKYYVDRAGIKERITPHSFRHGWAHKRRDQNAPLAFIQRGLGHVNPISTFIYEQYNDSDFERNANAYLKVA